MVTGTARFRNPHHHTLGDTIETLDFARMARVVRGLGGPWGRPRCGRPPEHRTPRTDYLGANRFRHQTTPK
jgi:hypothetical protein